MKMSGEEGFALPKPTKRVKTRETGNKYKDRSVSQEKRIAARLTAGTGLPFQTVPMSGAIAEKPGDVRTHSRVRVPAHKWLLELKSVEKTTGRGEHVLSIKLDWLVKIIRESAEENSLPALLIEYPGEGQEFVVLRLPDFERLLKEHVELTTYVDGLPIIQSPAQSIAQQPPLPNARYAAF